MGGTIKVKEKKDSTLKMIKITKSIAHGGRKKESERWKRNKSGKSDVLPSRRFESKWARDRASSHIYITIGYHVTTFARRASRFRVCLYSSTCARRGKSCKTASVARLFAERSKAWPCRNFRQTIHRGLI